LSLLGNGTFSQVVVVEHIDPTSDSKECYALKRPSDIDDATFEHPVSVLVLEQLGQHHHVIKYLESYLFRDGPKMPVHEKELFSIQLHQKKTSHNTSTR
jgi:hypothetical protein